jgi:beta-galactosidase/beta-glucuronidase
MSRKILLIVALISFVKLTVAQSTAMLSSNQTIRQNLSGTDKDHTVNWDFFCTKGRKSGQGTTIPVPSNWEFQGFGAYNYGHDKVKNDEEGLYKHQFKLGANAQKKRVFIVFEGSMTDTEVKINGQVAGPVHQGAFYRFKYDITALVKNGENLLEVKVSKMSADASINRAERNGDFWIFGGIYRPVYLEIVPETYIDRIAIDAKANGQIRIRCF